MTITKPTKIVIILLQDINEIRLHEIKADVNETEFVTDTYPDNTTQFMVMSETAPKARLIHSLDYVGGI